MEKNEYSIIDNYIFKNDIGEGNFGKVKLCIFKKTGEKFAVKIMNKKRIELIMKNKIFRENKIITKFHHLNVISVFQIIEDLSNYYIIMEYCEKGELFEYILSHQKLSEDECSLFFYQIINGVGHIHSRGVSHRDLKPENILLTDKNILKIIDFGLSHEFNETSELLNTKCGSPSYASPEIILGKEYDGFKSDIWSCGIILYAMATGYLPFEGENNKILFREILECKPDIPIYLSDDIHNLISSILTKNPDDRINIEDIKKHEFYLKGKKLFEKKYKNIFEIKSNIKILNEKENFGKKEKEKIIKNIVNKDYNFEEEEKSNGKVEMNSNYKNSNHKIKNIKNNDETQNKKIKFINSKNTIISFKNKIMNINLNFNKKIESLNEKMNHILSTDANTIIANKINNNPIYFSIINNTESNQNKDTSNNKKNINRIINKHLENKINNIFNNSNKQMELRVKTKNKKSKLELHKRNKITNITPFLKTSETSPTSTKLPSFGRNDTSSEKVFSLKSNTKNSSSKHSINNNDTYRINSKSNNQRLSSQNNIELINKFNYYLIGKKTIPKNKNSRKARNIGCKQKNFKSFKSHKSNNQIPFYNYKSNFTTTTANNSHSNNKDNSSSEETSQLHKLFTKYNNYNKKLIQRKKLLNKISLSAKNNCNNIIKNVRSIKSINSSKDKNSNQKKENKNQIKSYTNNSKNKNDFNKAKKLSEESNKSKSNIIKSLINNNKRNKNNIQINNLKKNICINNYIYKSNNSPSSSFNNNYKSKNKSIKSNSINVDSKKSSIMHLMQKNCNHMKTRKNLLQIKINYFNKNNIKKKINKRNSHKFYTNNNTYVNSINNLNSGSNSIKKMFYNKENISFKYLPSENDSEIRYSSRNNKHGKDILLTKIKDILKRRKKDVNYFLTSLNSVKSYKKKSFSNFVSRKGSSERSVKRINYSGLENNNITVNSVYKYMSNYRNEFSKKNRKYLNTNLNLKTLKNTPSDFLFLYKKKLISY